MSSTTRAPSSSRQSLSPGDLPSSEPGWTRTFSSLSIPHFRMLLISMLFSFTAIQMSFVTQNLLTYELEGNATSLGIVALGWGIPLLAFALVGGVAADRLHKRWLMIFSQATLAVSSVATAVLIQTDLIAMWHIFALAVATGTVFSFNVPARQAWIPELVGEEQLMNAVALNSTAFTSTGIAGPGLAGVLLAVPFVGLAEIYYLMGALYVVVVLMLLRIPGGEPVPTEERPDPIRDVADGLSYIRRHPVLPALLVMGFVPIVLGMPYRNFFPVFTEKVYGVADSWQGWMAAVMAVGALAGSLGVASLSNTSRRALIQIVGGLGFGISLVLFAAAPVLELGLVALLFVGLAANGYWALNTTMVLGASDPEYYGRVMSVYMLSWSIMPFAALPESALADAIGVQAMLAGVGVLLTATLLVVVLFMPGYRRLREQDRAGITASAVR